MKIVFDNIIYSLQKSGGGSVYWTELLERFIKSDNELIFFDQKEPNENIFRKTLDLDKVKNSSSKSLICQPRLRIDGSIPKTLIHHILQPAYYLLPIHKSYI